MTKKQLRKHRLPLIRRQARERREREEARRRNAEAAAWRRRFLDD